MAVAERQRHAKNLTCSNEEHFHSNSSLTFLLFVSLAMDA